MRFCPHCGSVLLPRRVNGVFHLVCRECGYEREALPGELARYRGRERVPPEAKVLTTHRVVRVRRGYTIDLGQYKDNYYEVVLENLGEYGE